MQTAHQRLRVRPLLCNIMLPCSRPSCLSKSDSGFTRSHSNGRGRGHLLQSYAALNHLGERYVESATDKHKSEIQVGIPSDEEIRLLRASPWAEASRWASKGLGRMAGWHEFVSLLFIPWEEIRSFPRRPMEKAASQPLCTWPGEWQLS